MNYFARRIGTTLPDALELLGRPSQNESREPSAIKSRMRWNLKAWVEVRYANKTPGCTPQLIYNSEGAALAVNHYLIQNNLNHPAK